MKKGVFIIIAIVTTLIISVFWIYALLFPGSAGTNILFTNFGNLTNNTPQNTTTINTDDSQDLAIDEKQVLEQLTLRPVAGFVSIVATSSEKIKYVEKGTGYIYEIDVNNNTETKISNKTFARTTEAYFSSDGEAVVIVNEENGTPQSTLINKGKETTLPQGVENIKFQGGELLYTTSTTGITTAYNYNLDTTTVTTKWQIPFGQVNVYFTDGDTFVINKVSDKLKGGVFTVETGGLKQVVEPNYSLVAISNTDGNLIAYTSYDDKERELKSNIYNKETGVSEPLVSTIVPEKCVFYSDDKIICASDDINNEVTNRDSVTSWYKGLTTYSDRFWIDRGEGEAALLIDTPSVTGQNVDVTDLSLTKNQKLLFINKTDNSLWMYKPQI